MTGLLLPCMVTSLRSLKDGSVSFCLVTQELSPGKAGELFSLRNKLVATYLSEKETIPDRELKQIDEISVELQGKTQSRRMRDVLWLNWNQNPEGWNEFAGYYSAKMERYIEELKNNLQ